MLPSILRGVVVAGATALVVVLSSTFGLSSPWPVLLVAAVALARPLRPGLVIAFLIGSVSWWLGMALRAGFLPDATSSLVIAAVVAVAIPTIVATLTRERLPLWAGLAGIALFAAFYEPTFAAEPTKFLAQSLIALAGIVVATGLGTFTALAAELLAGAPSARSHTGAAPTPQGVL